MVDTSFKPTADKISAPIRKPYLLRAGVWLSCVALLMLFVALRWNNFDSPLIRDEGEYFYSAILLKQGLAPYVHSFLQKPPMIAYTYALAHSVMPHSFWSARFLAYLFVALSTILLGIIARLEFGPGVALTAMWLFTIMVLQPGLEQYCANTEMFLVLPLLITVALFAWQREKKQSAAAWFCAGFFGAITFWYKYTALPLVGAIFLFWSFGAWRNCGKRVVFLSWCSAIAGAVLATLAVFGFFAAMGGLKECWNCTIVFNRFYAATGNFGLDAFASQLERMKWWWALFLLPLYFFTEPGGKVERRVWLWMGLFGAAWLATGMSSFAQYYIPLTPFWALLCALAINRGCSWLAPRIRWNPAILRWTCSALVIVSICLPDLSWMMRTRESFAAAKFSRNPFPESLPVAKRVAELTSPGDPVYTAGSEPQILFYANRHSPTRFVIAYPMMIPSPLALDYQKEAIADLEKSPPKVIVFATVNYSWLNQCGTPSNFLEYLKKQLDEHYEMVGGCLRAGDQMKWEEPILPQDMPDATLLLYRRKS